MTRELIPWRNRKRNDKPVKAEPIESHPIAALHRQMDDLFDSFFGDFEGFMQWPSMSRMEGLDPVMPRVNVSESDKEVRVSAEMAGMDEKDINVTLENNQLVIEGEKKSEQEDKSENYYLSERSYGRFHRSVPLPEGIDRDQVKATFKKGVLDVRIPKTEVAPPKGRKIEITGE